VVVGVLSAIVVLNMKTTFVPSGRPREVFPCCGETESYVNSIPERPVRERVEVHI